MKLTPLEKKLGMALLLMSIDLANYLFKLPNRSASITCPKQFVKELFQMYKAEALKVLDHPGVSETIDRALEGESVHAE